MEVAWYWDNSISASSAWAHCLGYGCFLCEVCCPERKCEVLVGRTNSARRANHKSAENLLAVDISIVSR